MCKTLFASSRGFMNESDMDPAFKDLKAKVAERVGGKSREAMRGFNGPHSNQAGSRHTIAYRHMVGDRKSCWRIISDAKTTAHCPRRHALWPTTLTTPGSMMQK